MTARIEKTVFISYRRTNLPWALFVYQNLTIHGYDVFFDYQSIDSGNFESVILDNIRARAHFIVILTPSALENCNKPGDWLRREIETAIVENRNIVPLMVENFDFGSPLVKEALTGKLSKLKTYNGLPIPNAYALEAMERLRERYLNKAISEVPTTALQSYAQKITETQKSAANAAAPVKEEQLTAQTWFEKGIVFGKAGNSKEAVRCYSEAIRIQQDFAEAYNNRGLMLWVSGDTKNALTDFNKAGHLNSKLAGAYFGRGMILGEKNDKSSMRRAIAAHNKAIKLQPDAAGYIGRGYVLGRQGKHDKAMEDFNTALQINPNHPIAYKYRGISYYFKGELDKAVSDLSKAIKLTPKEPDTYIFRARVLGKKGIYSKTIADYQKYLDLGGGNSMAIEKEVERLIQKMKGKSTKNKST